MLQCIVCVYGEILKKHETSLLRWRGHTRMGHCTWGILLRLLVRMCWRGITACKGDEVLFVSGSDCYGTPIALEAVAQGVDPATIADRYHTEFCRDFDALSFSFDLYTKTTTPEHQQGRCRRFF